jgi:hypothetical protein
MSDALVLPHGIDAGPDREVQVLLADRWRKLVLIQLRHGAVLADHTARVPITIQAVAGKGLLHLGARPMCSVPGSSCQSMRTFPITFRATLTWPSWFPSFVRPKRAMNTTRLPSLSNHFSRGPK